MINPPSLLLARPTFGRRVSALAPAEQSASRFRAAELDAAWQNLFCASDAELASAKEQFARLNG